MLLIVYIFVAYNLGSLKVNLRTCDAARRVDNQISERLSESVQVTVFAGMVPLGLDETAADTRAKASQGRLI